MNTNKLSASAALAILALAAVLEVGGDALVRSGLHAPLVRRASLFLAGALVLFAYGVVVNTTSWDFGKLLGIYIALFFVVAQLVNYFAFQQKPTLPILAGGSLIVLGGIVITVWEAGV
jgi:small multidrug resistance family-3 protein